MDVNTLPEADADTIADAEETLAGDMTAWLTDRVKRLPKTWDQMSEGEQTDIIVSAREAVRSTIGRAVRMIAAGGRPVIAAQLESVMVKDGIKAVVTLSRSDALRHALVDAAGQAVLLVVTDADRYMGGEMPKADPDEPQLPVDDDGPLFDKTDAGREAA